MQRLLHRGGNAALNREESGKPKPAFRLRGGHILSASGGVITPLAPPPLFGVFKCYACYIAAHMEL